ncbi:MAG: hypothetical protein LBP31_01400 [Holosporales bacterium]|nr:hypothetical protein [Holosporales bacterium]
MKNILVIVGVLAYIMGEIGIVEASKEHGGASNIVYTTIDKLFNDYLELSNCPADFEKELNDLPLQVKEKVDAMKEAVGVLRTKIRAYKGKGKAQDGLPVDDSVFVALNLALLDTISYVGQIMWNIDEAKTKLTHNRSNKRHQHVQDEIREIYSLIGLIGGNERVIKANEIHCLEKMGEEYSIDDLGPVGLGSNFFMGQLDPAISSSGSPDIESATSSSSSSSPSSEDEQEFATVENNWMNDKRSIETEQDNRKEIDKLSQKIDEIKEEMNKRQEETNKKIDDLTALFREFLKKK